MRSDVQRRFPIAPWALFTPLGRYLLLARLLLACADGSATTPNAPAAGTGGAATSGPARPQAGTAPGSRAGAGRMPLAGTGGESGSGGTGLIAPGVDAAVAMDAAVGADDGWTPSASSPLSDAQALTPDASWDCRMPQGLPPIEGAPLVFEATLTVGDVMHVGTTQYGDRTVLGIGGGAFSGPKIKGQVMDGALDWHLARPNGAVEIEGVAILRTDDGATIYLRNCGLAPNLDSDARIVPDSEAPASGAYAWLNTGTFVGKRVYDAATKTLTLSVYEAQPLAAGADTVTMPKKDAALPSQSWSCEAPAGAAGALVYTEQVGIGGSISIGESKYGSRNIIPITGGTFSGSKLNGDVIPGGADFQLTATGTSGLELDARYTLRTDDGELIVVRNCGAPSGTKLYFEALTTGNYAWLNTTDFTSSVGLAIGGVAISIYDVQ